MGKVIITAALTGAIHTPSMSPHLPFTQKRWCGAAGIDKVVTLSDHVSASFGEAYGVLMKEIRLLARARYCIDQAGAFLTAPPIEIIL